MLEGQGEVKVPFQGKQIEAREIQVLSASEPWNEYQLANGRILKSRTVAIGIYEAVSEKSEDSTPIYIVQSQTITRVVK